MELAKVAKGKHYLFPTLPISTNIISHSGGPNIGAIVGGVIGGVVFLTALILALFFLRRRSKHQKRQKERPVDLLNADEGDESPDSGPGGRASTRRNELPEYYQPEPFLVPDPTTRSSYDGTAAMSSEERPLSGYTSTSRSGTPDLLGSVYGGGGGGTSASGAGSSSAGGRKGAMRPMRPVNVIQHDDAGPQVPAGAAEEEVETVELPPAYTNIRK